MSEEPLISLREHQIEPFWRDDLGLMVLSWRRRGGKSHCMASKALRRMMERRRHTSIFMSASIKLGTEFIQKEAQVWADVLDKFRAASARKGMRLTSSADGLGLDDIADLFEHQKLETKIWHDNTTYSRSIVLAPNPDTAVGYGGDLYLDEYGRVPDFKDILEAVLPFLDENPELRAMFASTPPPDDAHYSWELTVPPADRHFPVDPKGNWYVSDAGFVVHRVTAHDTAAGGMPMYDVKTREPLTPEEHRARAFDKEAWDRNYGVIFLRGGTSAVSLLAITDAQAQGANLCLAAQDDFPTGWRDKLGPGPFSFGYDIATTTNEKSNPSSLTISEKVAGKIVPRLIVRWKTADPDKAIAMLEEAFDLGPDRRVKCLVVDASNERYFAARVRKHFAGRCRVILIVSGEKTTYGGEEMIWKVYLGNLLVNLLEEGQMPLPAAKWIKDDFRLVKRDRGGFYADVANDGSHADTFDSTKLSAHGLISAGGPAEAEAMGATSYGITQSANSGWIQRHPDDFKVTLHA